MTTPDPLDPSLLDPESFSLKGKQRPRWPLYLVLGAALLVGGGFMTYRIITGRTNAKLHAGFLRDFDALEKDGMGAFWVCLLGPNADPRQINTNVALGQRLETMFVRNALEFPDTVVNECIPKLTQAQKRAESIEAPSEYVDALVGYTKSIPSLASSIRAWAERARERAADRIAELKVVGAAKAFHAVAGDVPPTAVAYDRVLRCAVPGVEKLRDGQALAERMFAECKKPDFLERVRGRCSRLAEAGGKVDGNFKQSLRKFGPDDRDLKAWEDCFRRSRKGDKQDEFEAFAKAWIAHTEAGNNVRKIAAAALQE